MQFGRVHGSAICTMKIEGLEGLKLLIVQPLDERLNPIGSPVVATDTERVAGYGDLVYTVSGGDAADVIPGRRIPVDIAIVGLVDSIHLLGDRS